MKEVTLALTKRQRNLGNVTIGQTISPMWRSVKECEQCQRRNSPRVRHRPSWRPFNLNIHSRKAHVISWGHYQCQLRVTSTSWMVVTDLFTKWVEAFPLRSTESTTLATVLADEIVRRGVPTNIKSDQGANFTSAVIQHLCSLLGMGHTQTTAYHPQGTGQVERFNRTLEAMVAMVVQANQRDWNVHLPRSFCLPYCSTRSHVVHTLPPSLWPLPHVTSGCDARASLPSLGPEIGR